MKNPVVIAVTVVAAVVVALFAIYFIDIDQTREAKLPDVDVNVKGGQAPEFDVKTGKVKITKEKVDVAVPKVTLEEKEVAVPGVEITPPSDEAAD